jgi:hypothetical protein
MKIEQGNGRKEGRKEGRGGFMDGRMDWLLRKDEEGVLGNAIK